MTDVWPIDLLPCRDFSINPSFRNTRGQAAIAYGEAQIVASDAGVWKATLGSIRVSNSEQRKRFRALQVKLEGGLTPILIPLCGADQPVSGNAFALWEPWPEDDELFFGDGATIVTLASDAARRATQVSVTITTARVLEEGQHFSAGERLYRIKEIASQTDTAAILKIWPPLREALTTGAALEFENPVCRMRLASDQEMDLDLAMRRSAQPTVSFVEAL